jgi:hypothetical protein
MNDLKEAQYQRMLEIHKRDSVITVEAVVEDGQNPESPLYSIFERDTAKCVENWHKVQARQAIAYFEIRYTDSAAPARRLTYIPSREGWLPTEDVLKSPSLFAEAALTLKREVDQLVTRNKSFFKLHKSLAVVKQRLEDISSDLGDFTQA